MKGKAGNEVEEDVLWTCVHVGFKKIRHDSWNMIGHYFGETNRVHLGERCNACLDNLHQLGKFSSEI